MFGEGTSKGGGRIAVGENSYINKKIGDIMKNINVIYDYEYDNETDTLTVADDVDIISVPDFVCEHLEEIVQKFFDWTTLMDSGCWVKMNGEEVCCVGTADFLRWLNENYYSCEEKESVLIEEHTKYRPELPCAEF